MKNLNGADLAEFIKARQAKQVRQLRQSKHVAPKLAIIQTTDNPVISTYVRLKQAYGQDISVETEVHSEQLANVPKLIERLNHDDLVSGIIVQLPLSDPSQTDDIVNLVAPKKDVDALGKDASLPPATPTAINWLLAGYNIELKAKKIVIVGGGRLVGRPLFQQWQTSGYDVRLLNESDDVGEELKRADIIIAATGQPGILSSDMIPIGCVVVDAGVASDSGKTLGDVQPDVYQRHDVILTPQKGGVGPLTVAALFENVIRAASQ